MCIIILVDTTATITVYLTDGDSNPVLGLTFADVSVSIRKEGGSFTAKSLTALNFVELGAGFYDIHLSVSDTDTLGNFLLRVSGASIVTSLWSALIVDELPGPSPTPPLGITETLLFGYILDIAGDPVYNASVTYRVLASPSVSFTGTEGLVLTTGSATVKTDSSGFFSFEAVTGADIDIFIPSSNYRRTLKVPASSTNIFDIP